MVPSPRKRHYRATERNLMQFCADLRRLQDGRAHFVRGFDSFGAYVQHTFDLSPASAKQLSRQGQALLVLEAGERISLTGTGENLPGTTGLRALASVLNQHGEKIMLSVHDRAAALRPGRKIVGETVTTAMRGLIATSQPKQLDPSAEGQPAEHSFHDEHDDDEDDQPEEAHELFDRAYRLREILNDFSLAVSAHKFQDARRASTSSPTSRPSSLTRSMHSKRSARERARGSYLHDRGVRRVCRVQRRASRVAPSRNGETISAMTVWRIKINSMRSDEDGGAPDWDEAKACCRAAGLVGVGWGLSKLRHGARLETVLSAWRERPDGKGGVGNITRLASEVKEGDLMWTRDSLGQYWLGQITGSWRYDKSPESVRLDLYNVRPCRWLEKPFRDYDVQGRWSRAS